MFETKAQRLERARRDLAQTLARVGYSGGKKRGSSTLVIAPSAKFSISTSDVVPGNGAKKHQPLYTGQELAGVTLLHKQGYEPVRKDNLQAATEASQMRRS